MNDVQLSSPDPITRRRGLLARAVLLAIGALLLAGLAAPAALAAPGDLDPAFAGGAGTERFYPSDGKVFLGAVATQPDDKIVLAGFEAPGSVIVVRLLADGKFDPSFGTEGKVTTPFTGTGNFGDANAVAVQPDGKIVVAGSAKGATNTDFMVARYDADGHLDSSFGGGDGVEIFPVGLGEDTARAVALGAGGRILVAGEARSPVSGEAAAVAVLQPSGKLDPSFSTDGITLLETTGVEASDRGEGIIEQPDGKLVVADSTGNGAGNGFTLVRLLAGGAPDPSFDGDGIVRTPMPSATNPGAKGRVTSLALQPDGRIVAAGYGFDEVGPTLKFDTKFAAARYLATGALDPSFGDAGSGIFTRQVGEGDDSARALALTPSGQLLLSGGYEAAPTTESLAAVRLGPSGALDPSFGSGGIVRRGVTAQFGETWEASALDSRERLVLVSRSFEGNETTRVVVTRLLGDKPPAGPEPAPNEAPHARIKKLPKKVRAAELKRFAGTAADPEGSLARVQIAVTGKVRGGRACLVMKNAKARLKRVKLKKGRACPQRWLTAKGTARWSFRLRGELPPGRYVVFARAVDREGGADTRFARKLGNRLAFRVIP
ncbi:MAG: delta-60 repeat domain-containing protein [Solirubrobacterales bacterium]